MKNIFQAAALLLLAFLPLQGQIITTEAERAGILSGLEQTLEPAQQDTSDYGSVPSPFDPVKVKRVAAAPRPQSPVAQGEAAPVVDALPQRLADADALRVIGDSFKPIGTLVRGDRGLLRMSSGAMLAAGTSFRAEINGLDYEVLVKEVTSQGYTLSLGTATLSRSFYSTGGTQP